MAAWPDATNTGVPPGTTLDASGGLTITKAGTVIDALDVHGSIYVQADNVTIRNSRVTSSDFAPIWIGPDVTGTTVEDCEINGLGAGGQGISGSGTFLRNNIYGVGDGINVSGDHVLIQDNYIHDLQGTSDSHYDGIQIDGSVNDVRIEHNTVINDHTQTSAVMIDDYFGPTSNVVVNNNLLAGGGYTIYVTGVDGHGTTNVEVTNNHLEKGEWGYTYFDSAHPTYTGNEFDGGALISTLGTDANIDTGTDTGDSAGGGTVDDGGTSTDGSSASGSDSGSGTDSGGTDGSSGSGSTDGSSGSGSTDGSSGSDSGSGSGSYDGHDQWWNPDRNSSSDTTADAITGTNRADHLVGTAGADTIDGGNGNDVLNGGLGPDTLTGGGGNDRFVFNSINDSGVIWDRDVITDFQHGRDTMDFSGIDANTSRGGNQAFTFLAQDDAIFTHHRGELAWHTDEAHNQTIVQGDVDGDGASDFDIAISGIVHLDIHDFVL